LIDLGERVHQSLLGTYLDDSLLRFSQNIYLREQLMIDLCYCLALTFSCIAMDGDQFSLTIGFRSKFIQPSSQVNYHLDKLSAGEADGSSSSGALMSRRVTLL